jgi:hypothetical protein
MTDKLNSDQFAGAGSVPQKDASEIYDGSHGKYHDAVADDPNTEKKLPTTSFPQAPDPSPFKIGPMSPGGR